MSRHTIIMIHDLIELDAYRLCNVQPAPEHIHFDRLLRILMLTRKFCLCSLLRHFYSNMSEKLCIIWLIYFYLLTFCPKERLKCFSLDVIVKCVYVFAATKKVNG